MHPAEQLLTDIVSAIAAATAIVSHEIESHQTSKNFRARNAAQSINSELLKLPGNASNSKTVAAIYSTFIAHLNGKPETAPDIPIDLPTRAP